MMRVAVALVLVLGLMVLALVFGIRRSARNGEVGDGADVIPYLVLALAMGVAGFALAELASTAFPGETFVFDPAENVATSLSTLVVSAPFAVYFWYRQARRRVVYPSSPGWTLYLAVIELTFTTAFVVTTIMFLNGVITDSSASAWTGMLIFGAIVVLHEVVARRTPPLSDAGELRRVIGSAIGLIPAAIGLVGIVIALLTEIDLFTDPPDSGEFEPFVAMTIVGSLVWWYRWMRPWDAEAGPPRLTWAVIVSVGSLATALGAATGIAVLIAQYVFTSPQPAETHFEPTKVLLALVLAGIPTWLIHRRTLHQAEGNALAVYRYALAALGLGMAVSMAIALTVAAFDTTLIVGASGSDVVTFTVVLLTGLTVWLVFERRAAIEEPPASAWPHNIYTLGMGVLFALVAAGALITALFILIRRILGGEDTTSVLTPTTVLLYTGLAAWYLLGSYIRARPTVDTDEAAIAPFEVTIICSHPGMISNKFPRQAKLRVIHRADDAGRIDEEMADEIVAAVGNRTSLVWVDEDGFRVAPRRPAD